MTLLNKNVTAILFGIFLFLIWMFVADAGYIALFHLHVSIGHLAYLSLLVLLPFRLQTHWIWIASSTLALLDLLHLIYQTNDLKPPSWSQYSLFIMIAVLLLLVLAIALSRIKQDIAVSRQSTVIIAFSTIFAMSVYHLINVYLKFVQLVPNEQRSIMIGGLEIHHINYGIILLAFVPLLCHAKEKTTGIFSFAILILIGLIYGTVFDESFYYMLDAVTDDAYFSPLIVGLQFLFAVVVFLSWPARSNQRRHHA